MSMSISLQKSSTKTNIKHNNRTMSEKEQERNPHIDQSRSHENKYLVQEDLKELYEREFGGALEKYNAKQKRNDRKIKDYYKHVQSSKKTSLQQEMIIQVGDKDDFSNNEKRELANEVLQDWFKEFEEVSATTTATAQQQSEIELKQYALQLQNALKQMGTTMQIIANQKEEISELRKHIAVMENKQQEYINTKLDERDQKLIESIKEIQETKKQLAATQQKKWWQFRK